MPSPNLKRLSADDTRALITRLHEQQRGNCFICNKPIDLAVHANKLDIDHVIPSSVGGKDDPSNFALTHESCNRSKQGADLRVARIMCRFGALKERLAPDNRAPNLGDVLREWGASEYRMGFNLSESGISYSFSDAGDNAIRSVPLYEDGLSGFRYFFMSAPIDYLRHDDKINPRTIGSNIRKLVEEFHQKRPQLHVPLAWMDSGAGPSSLHVFDGQHKAAAHIMLGAKTIPLRVFLDPDKDVLITANTNAGTKLKQVAFDKSVQRHLGSSLYQERIERFRADRGLDADDHSFSEQDIVRHFRGQRDVKGFITDAVRNAVTSSPENKLRDFIEMGGRGKVLPLSYSTVDKFYSLFIGKEPLTRPLDDKAGEGENPRELEVRQIVRLMNIIADAIYIGQFETELGTHNIEARLQKGEEIPDAHLRAFRISNEHIIHSWLLFVKEIITTFYAFDGKRINPDTVCQYQFPEKLWKQIDNFVKNFADLPIWVNKGASETVFGGNPPRSVWQKIFETGKMPQGMQVMAPVNFLEMIERD